MNTFNDINVHPRDARLLFDAETHSYSLDDGTSLQSVTTIIDDCFPKFDAEYWSLRKSGGDPARAAELRALWDENARISRDLGTDMHARIEQYYLHPYDPTDPGVVESADSTMRLFLQFAAQHHLKPFRSEWRIFYEKYNLAGTLDFLTCDNGRFEIWDWKRSNKLVDKVTHEPIRYNQYQKKALPPIDHIDDTSYMHYAIQLSIYRYILEECYDISPVAGHLGVFHPEHSRPYVIDVPYLRDEVIAILNTLR